MKRVTAISLAMLALALGAITSSASAEWGYGCDRPETSHCYGLADWLMNGKGEEVLGLVSWITTERMNVFDWYQGTSVSNEEWAADTPFPLWAEVGQEAGYDEGGGSDCCTLHWFTAWYTTVNNYGSNESPWVEPGWTPNHYLTAWCRTGFSGCKENQWCFEIGSGRAGCTPNGLFATATEVEVGMEAGTIVEPENWGHDETAVDWLNNNWHHWNTARYLAMKYGGKWTNHVCVGPPSPYPGWATWGTC